MNLKIRKTFASGICCLLFVISINVFAGDNILPDWNGGKNKEIIIEFVKDVTDAGSKNYISPDLRIAVFDNDGTVQVEKPYAFVDMFALYRIRDLAINNPEHLTVKYPEWKNSPVITKLANAELTELPGILAKMKYDDLIMLFNLANTSDFQTALNSALHYYAYNYKHIRFNEPPVKLIYKPMIELIKYLNENQFKVYFVSGSTTDYLRQFSENIGIPKENVIGWNYNAELKTDKKGKLEIYKTGPAVEPVSNNNGKVVDIERMVGKIPVIAVGNSSGDIAMLTYTHQNKLPSMCLIVKHDDPVREYEYDFGEKVSRAAEEQGWHVISMKNDFKIIF